MRTTSTYLTVAALALALVALAGCKKEQPSSEPSEPAEKEEVPVAPGAEESDEKPPESEGEDLGEAAGDYEIDPVHSVAVFRIGHVGVSHYYGTFNKVTGKITLAQDPAESKVEIEIDPNSVFTADKKRDTHIKSPDFLDVKQFKKMSFKSSQVESLGDGKYKVTGDLELHGEKKPVTAEVELIGSAKIPPPMDDYRAGLEAQFTFSRKDFGISFAEGMLSDEIQVIVAVEGIKK